MQTLFMLRFILNFDCKNQFLLIIALHLWNIYYTEIAQMCWEESFVNPNAFTKKNPLKLKMLHIAFVPFVT